MKKILFLILINLSTISFSQSLKETMDWINKYSYDRHYVNEVKDGKITLVSTRYMPGYGTSTEIDIIDPRIVKRIIYNVDNDGWGSIYIKYKGNYLISNRSIMKYEGSAKIHKDTDESKKNNRSQYVISIPSGKDTERVFKAYLHLFRIFNKDILQGDTF